VGGCRDSAAHAALPPTPSVGRGRRCDSGLAIGQPCDRLTGSCCGGTPRFHSERVVAGAHACSLPCGTGRHLCAVHGCDGGVRDAAAVTSSVTAAVKCCSSEARLTCAPSHSDAPATAAPGTLTAATTTPTAAAAASNPTSTAAPDGRAVGALASSGGRAAAVVIASPWGGTDRPPASSDASAEASGDGAAACDGA